jgi:O-acetyl-ADP-ribose deacetylase (regulator of RNase III)
MGVLKTVATFGLVGGGGNNNKPLGISLNIVRGSVLDFIAPSKERIGAIVNAANEGCLGGGGVDGAINNAGGKNLWKDREELPLVQIAGTRTRSSSSSSSSDGIRCPTGGAVITGPNSYGSLKVPYIIHAVGPNYFQFSDNNNDDSSSDDENENNNKEFSVPDSLLRSAYQNSLKRCNEENNITDVGFSLLSAGIFRGNRSQEDVLRIGIIAIHDYIIDIDLAANTADGFDYNGVPDDDAKEEKGGKEKQQQEEEQEIALEAALEPSQEEEEEKEQCKNKDVDGSISNNIASAAYPHKLKAITLCGFNTKEVNLLLKICNEIFNNNENNNNYDKDRKNPSKRPLSPTIMISSTTTTTTTTTTTANTNTNTNTNTNDNNNNNNEKEQQQQQQQQDDTNKMEDTA